MVIAASWRYIPLLIWGMSAKLVFENWWPVKSRTYK
jgi:hypothetical protein